MLQKEPKENLLINWKLIIISEAKRNQNVDKFIRKTDMKRRLPPQFLPGLLSAQMVWSSGTF